MSASQSLNLDAYENHLLLHAENKKSITPTIKKVKAFLDWLDTQEIETKQPVDAYKTYLKDDLQRAESTISAHISVVKAYLGWSKQTQYEDDDQLYTVGIGASAGGLEALERFFSSENVNPDLSYVVIQHLSPDFKSMMPDILARVTDLQIHSIEDGMKIEPGHIYLNNPRSDISIIDNRFVQTAQSDDNLLHLPINAFLQSLSKAKKDKAVAIILSGTGRDGSSGVSSINDHGGLVITQDARSAAYPSMPESAALQGPAHLVLNPADMPEAVNNFVSTRVLPEQPEVIHPDITGENAFSYALSLLQREYGIDFDMYKNTTLIRRIERRMNLANEPSLEHYATRLQDNIDELDALYRDMLVDVTSFFRDEEAFSILREKVIPEIVRLKKDSDPIRAWVAACASGEEAYSVAILFLEEIAKQGKNIDLKVFATDAHKGSILRASMGVYDDRKLLTMSPSLKSKYFELEDHTYKVKKELRQKIIFAPHNLLSDGSFSNLDFVSCRNILIYLKPEGQVKVLTQFSNGLHVNGILFLGSSEHLGTLRDYYTVINEKWRIYQKLRHVPLGQQSMSVLLPRLTSTTTEKAVKQVSWERDLLKALVPSGYVVDAHGQLIEVIGDARHYLKFKAGRVNLNLSAMLDEPLATTIKSGLYNILNSGEALTLKGIKVNHEDITFVEVDFIPFESTASETTSKSYLIRINPSQVPMNSPSIEVSELDMDRVLGLERELEFTRESLQASLEELETTNEELQSTNEELLASNEELQSTNEELSSVNEELITVNAEFQTQNKRLNQTNNDLENLLRNTNTTALFLGTDLRIRMITPGAFEVFDLLESDVGRPIAHFAPFLSFGPGILEDLCRQALRGKRVNKRVSLYEERQFELHVVPYEEADNLISGIILTFVDVTLVIARTQETFQQQLNTLGSLGNLMPGIVSYYDRVAKKSLYSSKSLAKVLGYAEDFEVTEESVKKLAHPNDIGAGTAYMDSVNAAVAVSDGTPFSFDYRLRHAHGHWEWFRSNILPEAWSDDGTVTRYLNYRENITAEKENAHLTQELTIAKDVSGISPISMYIYDVEEDRNIYATGNIFDLLGYSSEDLLAIGEGLLMKLMHPEDLADFEAYQKSIAKDTEGKLYTFDYRLRHKDKHYVNLRSLDSVYRRTKEGAVKQLRGFAINLDNLKETRPNN